MKKTLLAISIFLFLSFGNNLDRGETIKIKVDIDSVQELNIGDYVKDMLILTKDNKPYLLGVAAKIITVSDGYIIYDYHKGINKFDFEGRFIKQIPYEGVTKNKYGQYYVDLWIKNDSIYIYDSIKDKIFIFNNQGVFIKTKSPKQKEKRNTFSYILPYNNKYIGVKEYSDIDSKSGLINSQFAVYNSNFEYIKDFTNEKLNAHRVNVNLGETTYNNEILYIKTFMYDIFSIDESENVSKKYFIDFMKYALPEDFITMKNRFAFIMEKENQYVFGIADSYESDDYLYFKYAYRDKANFVVHDKKANKSKPFKLINSEDYTIKNFFINNDMVMCYLESEKDVAILKIKIEDFIR